MSLILHGVPLSPFVRKVRTVLAEKKLDYDMKMVVPYATRDEYSEINPLRRVPALQDGDITLCDSAIICQYLETTHPSPSLIPNSPALAARCQWLEKYADYELAPDSTFKVFFQRIVQPTFGKETDDDVVKDAIEKRMPPHLDYLESQLNGQSWFIENQFSLADIAVATQLLNLKHAGYSLDAARWPYLANLLTRFCERPVVAEMLQEEIATLDKVRARFNISATL